MHPKESLLPGLLGLQTETRAAEQMHLSEGWPAGLTAFHVPQPLNLVNLQRARTHLEASFSGRGKLACVGAPLKRSWHPLPDRVLFFSSSSLPLLSRPISTCGGITLLTMKRRSAGRCRSPPTLFFPPVTSYLPSTGSVICPHRTICSNQLLLVLYYDYEPHHQTPGTSPCPPAEEKLTGAERDPARHQKQPACVEPPQIPHKCRRARIFLTAGLRCPN